MRALCAVVFLVLASCGSTSGGGLFVDAGSGADGSSTSADAAPSDAAASDGAVADGPSCPDLRAKMLAQIVKTCGGVDDCALVVDDDCCNVYIGIRKDKVDAFKAAQAAYTTACPDLRGCQCADHTETGEALQATPPVVRCDNGACTAHAK
jgi:hypothetical protein